MDKVFSEDNLFWSWVQVAQNKGAAGVDHMSIDEFAKRLVPNLKRLTETLRENKYQPQDVKRVWIPKPGSNEQRPLGIPTVRDRRHGRLDLGAESSGYTAYRLQHRGIQTVPDGCRRPFAM